MRKLLFGIGLVVLTAVPAQGTAQTTLSMTGGVHEDLDFGVAVRLAGPFRRVHERVRIGVTFAKFFPGQFDYLQFDGDLFYDFDVIDELIQPYVGAGVTVGHGSDRGVSESEAGMNLRVGANFEINDYVMPMILGTYQIGGGTPDLDEFDGGTGEGSWVIMVGLSFLLNAN